MKIVFICVSLIVFSVSFLPLIVSSDLPTFLIGCLLTRVAAQGEADAQLTKAKAEAESIAIRAKALRDNPQVLMLEAISRWDGKLPTYLGGDSLPAPLMQLKEQK